MLHEPARTKGRRAAGPPLRGALLWAVVGAALFLGVGAALPVWTNPWVVARVVEDGGEAPHLVYEPTRGTLWWITSSPWDAPRAGILADALALLAGGVMAGLLGYVARRAGRRWKGGGASRPRSGRRAGSLRR